MKIGLFFFSGTGNTAKIASIIKEQLEKKNYKIDLINITSHTARNTRFEIEGYSFIIFGFPVYAWRIPKVTRDWLKTLNGDNRGCFTFFTYGGISIGVAHYDTIEILRQQGFYVIASAEFLAKHTYNIGGWDLLESRPNDEDKEVAKEYAVLISEKIENGVEEVVNFNKQNISDEKLEYISRHRYTLFSQFPSRKGKECSLCRICEEECPTNAFNADTGETDKEKCIICLHCVISCPESVIQINEIPRMYEKTFKRLGLTKQKAESRKSAYFQ